MDGSPTVILTTPTKSKELDATPSRDFQQIVEPASQVNTPCDCFHDYSPTEHYLSLPTVNVLAGDAEPQSSFVKAEACFMSAKWIAAIRGESPDGYVPPSTRYLCNWCKDHWVQFGNPGNTFEQLS